MISDSTGASRFVRPGRWTLRTRLLAMLVALLGLVCLVVGVVTVLALRGFLIGRLDSQLASAGARSVNNAGQAQGQPPASGQFDPARFILAPGSPVGTLGVRLTGGKVDQASVVTDRGDLQALSTTDVTGLTTLSADGHPHTRAVGDRGDYRLLATTTSDGDVLITGLPMRDLERTVYRLIAVEVGVALAGLVLATVAGIIIVRRTLRPLERVAATASRVSTLPLERGEVALAERLDASDVDDRTEVGQVAGAVNRLLDHVSNALSARHESETRVRQFVADASHELRTPLASIRGYAELTRRSRETAPPDIAYAMSRVESETARMTTMVEDLLLLARLDEGRPPNFESVDLTHLLLDTVSDATAAGRDHQWRMNLPEQPVLVNGDASSLHQVVANLLANARTHTPPGTTITTGLASSSPDTVVISVLDDGPGIAPEIVPTIFERFARGDGSRTRAAGSTGLGLAIVQAIVQAHGGTVAVTSRPGQTAFLVRLPVDRTDADGL